MPNRAALFDLDNTLHDRDASILSFVRFQHAQRGFSFPVEDWVDRFVALERNGRVWKDAVYKRLVEEFALDIAFEDLLDEYYEGYAAHVKPAEGLVEIFTALREKGWRRGVITNGLSVFQRRTLAAVGVEPMLDVLVVSEECGFRKPDPEIFHLALNQLGCRAEDSWFVGDDPVADIEGASKVGMKTLWMHKGVRLRDLVEPLLADPL